MIDLRHVHHWAIAQKIRPGPRSVLFAIAAAPNDTLSLGAIASMAGISRRSAAAYVAELEMRGAIRVTHRPGEASTYAIGPALCGSSDAAGAPPGNATPALPDAQPSDASAASGSAAAASPSAEVAPPSAKFASVAHASTSYITISKYDNSTPSMRESKKQRAAQALQNSLSLAGGALGGATQVDAYPGPGDAIQQWATDQGLTRGQVEAEYLAFSDWHRARGTAFVDWDAAFRGWLRRGMEYRRAENARRGLTTAEERLREWRSRPTVGKL